MSEINKNINWKDVTLSIFGKSYPIQEVLYERKPISISLTKEEIIELDKASKIAGSRELKPTPVIYANRKKYKGRLALLIHLNKFL